MELKTLKDLIKDVAVDQYDPVDYKVDPKDLRQEAIKWINKLKQAEKSTGMRALFASIFKMTDAKGTIEWIKYFFNITEEDLK